MAAHPQLSSEGIILSLSDAISFLAGVEPGMLSCMMPQHRHHGCINKCRLCENCNSRPVEAKENQSM